MIAVTGANGLLGSFIVRKLVEQQKPFVALKRHGSDLSLLRDIHDQVTWRTADVLDPVAIEEALQDVTEVIHAAAVVSYHPSLGKKIFDSNVLGTRHVVNACLANNIKRLVHVSSIAALGRQKDQTVVTEQNKWVDNAQQSTYAESKYLAELEVFRGQEEGLSTVIINPSVILAPADWNKSSAKLFKYVWNEKKFYVDFQLNYVDVRDVVEITHQLLSGRSSGRFIVNAGSIPLVDFLHRIGEKFGKRAPNMKLSPKSVKIAAFAEGLRARISGAEPLITPETARLAGSHFFYSNDKIKKTLNFDFRSIDDTIEWCCQYYILNFISKK